jgi:predicted RNA binding protein YcfA (HicA-like mRNA interferase family)
MDLSPKRILKILKENGWILDRIKGSESVPVPIHGNQDLKKGTYFAILKAIGVDKNEI